MALNICQRVRSTESQVGKKAIERRHNLKGAFLVTKDLAGKHVVLIDDVMTTGSMVDLLAHTLKRAGAAYVGVWVCARAAHY